MDREPEAALPVTQPAHDTEMAVSPPSRRHLSLRRAGRSHLHASAAKQSVEDFDAVNPVVEQAGVARMQRRGAPDVCREDAAIFLAQLERLLNLGVIAERRAGHQ